MIPETAEKNNRLLKFKQENFEFFVYMDGCQNLFANELYLSALKEIEHIYKFSEIQKKLTRMNH